MEPAKIRYLVSDQTAWTVLDDSPTAYGCVDYLWSVRTWDDIVGEPWVRPDRGTWRASLRIHGYDYPSYQAHLDPLDLDERRKIPLADWQIWQISYTVHGVYGGYAEISHALNRDYVLCGSFALDDLAGRWVTACALAAAANTLPPRRSDTLVTTSGTL